MLCDIIVYRNSPLDWDIVMTVQLLLTLNDAYDEQGDLMDLIASDAFKGDYHSMPLAPGPLSLQANTSEE